MKKFLLAFVALTVSLFGQVNVQKSPAAATLDQVTGSLVIGSGKTLTATGTGTISATSVAGNVTASGTLSGTPTGGTLSLANTTLTLPTSFTWAGTLAATNGGTGQSTWTLGDFLYANGTNTLAKLAGSTSATLAVLTQTGTGTVSAAPVWTSTTGTGNVVRATSPTLVTPTLGAATATSIVSGTISSPGSGTASERFGLSASTSTATQATAIGASASVTGSFGTALGNAASSADSGVALGYAASSTATYGVAIGRSATAAASGTAVGSFNNAAGSSIALGYNQTAATGDIVLGIGNVASEVYIGQGKTAAADYGTRIQPASGNGAAVAGGTLRIAGGKGGDAATAGGSVILQTAAAGTGTTLTDRLTIAPTGTVTVAGPLLQVLGSSFTKTSLDSSGSSNAVILNSNTAGNYRTLKFSYGATPTTMWEVGYQGATANTNLNFQPADPSYEAVFYGTGASTTTTSGALQTRGGLGVSGASYFGGDMTISKANAKLTLNDTSNTAWSLRASAGYLTFGNVTNAIDPLSLTGSTLATSVLNLSSTKSASSAISGALTIGNGAVGTNVAIGGGNIVAGGTITAGSTTTYGELISYGSAGPWKGLTLRFGTGTDGYYAGQVSNTYSYAGNAYYSNSNLYLTQTSGGATTTRFAPDGTFSVTSDTGLTANTSFTPTVRFSLTPTTATFTGNVVSNATTGANSFSAFTYFNDKEVFLKRTGVQDWAIRTAASGNFELVDWTSTLTRLSMTPAGAATFAGAVSLSTAGTTISIKSGTNAAAGTVTLVGGTATITSTAIDVNTVIVMSVKTSGGTIGDHTPSVKVNAGNAVITGSASDTSTYNWIALKVN